MPWGAGVRLDRSWENVLRDRESKGKRRTGVSRQSLAWLEITAFTSPFDTGGVGTLREENA